MEPPWLEHDAARRIAQAQSYITVPFSSKKARPLVWWQVCEQPRAAIPGHQCQLGSFVQCRANVHNVRQSVVADVLHGGQRGGVPELRGNGMDVGTRLRLSRGKRAAQQSGCQGNGFVRKHEPSALAEQTQSLPDPLRVRNDPPSPIDAQEQALRAN